MCNYGKGNHNGMLANCKLLQADKLQPAIHALTINLFNVLLVIALAQNDADIRLVNHLNNNTFEGRVEIYHGTKWGTICDDYFGMEEADVVCKQLNFTLGAQAVYKSAYYGQGTGNIYLDNVVCVGNETSLINCKHQGWNGHNCHHFEDVGVVCLTNGRYRLNLHNEEFTHFQVYFNRLPRCDSCILQELLLTVQ